MPNTNRPTIVVDFVKDPSSLRRLADGSWVSLVATSTRMYDAHTVVCGDFVSYLSEDGHVEGRCGAPVVGPEGFACEGHTEERLGWAAMNEAQRCDWERKIDQDR